MAQFITEHVPNGEVEAYCKLQKELGATKCAPTDNGDGTSNILVEFPDKEL